MERLLAVGLASLLSLVSFVAPSGPAVDEDAIQSQAVVACGYAALLAESQLPSPIKPQPLPVSTQPMTVPVSSPLPSPEPKPALQPAQLVLNHCTGSRCVRFRRFRR